MLNPQQEEIVRHHGRPLLVVAGAGSGKTKTLAHKVEFILRNLRIKEDQVLCITFTNKASNEIKERILKVTGKELRWAGTFHSVAYRILKKFGKLNFSIADESDTREILKMILPRYNINLKDLDKVKAFISRVKEDLGQIRDETLRSLFEEYQNTLRDNRLFDFSDLMYELWRLLLEKEELREELRRKFRFILVDEYQDTNTVQYEILKLLADRDICVIGDPNQCIYEWRFARPDNIVRFIEDFNPDIKKLEINYRSKGYILKVANAFLKNSQHQWKDLIPELRSVKDMGEKPLVNRFGSPQEEAIWIAEKIKALRESYSYSEMAVLVRSSYLTEVFESTFFKMGIPYRVVGSVSFYERAEVKDLIYLLKLINDPSSELAFRRVLRNFFNRSERKVAQLRPFFKGDWIETLKYNHRDLYLILEGYRRMRDNYPLVLKRVVRETKFLDILSKRYKDAFDERLENVREFLSVAEENYKAGASLEDFLEEIYLMSSEDSSEEQVRIMTVHASKGLEFSVVFLPRLEEGVFPHRSAKEDKRELEEERRLFYVAITRAKELLFLTYTRDRDRKPSRFLSDIPKSLLNLEAFKKTRKSYSITLKPNPRIREGTYVNHRIFGVGKVLEVEGERARVDFMGKVKTIHTAFLETLD